MAEEACPFCAKLARLDSLPAEEVVWRFRYSVALLGPWQFYQGYCILISRRHATELNQLLDKERYGYLDEMCQLAEAIQSCFKPDKLNYELLGNQVPHLHWHLFPRTHRDPDALKPVWLALERAERDATERRRLQASSLDRVAITAALRAELTKRDASTSWSRPLRIGTRGSSLALRQANHVARLLRPHVADRAIELVEIKTAGDEVRDVPLATLGGQGVFTKEIQKALLDDRVDVAVHSLKDLPTIPVDGVVLAAVPPRGPTGDVFVSQRYRRFDDLPAGAVIATSSLRRRAQVLHRRRDLTVVDIRGNVETRLRKLEEQALDGLILAQAGLERLGLQDRITEVLDPAWMLPAVGQGALGLECRTADGETRALLLAVNHSPTHQAVLAERAFLRALQGGCQVPIGAAGGVRDGTISLRGAVLSPDGTRRIEGTMSGENAEEIGENLASELLKRGAGELLAVSRSK
jgi:hydroxymethylbilane synthase